MSANTAFIMVVIAAYLLGSLSGSLLLGRLRGVDIRNSGSGNAGGTNAFRTQGLLFAVGVVLIDLGKGAVAAGLLPGWIAAAPANPGLAAAAGVAAIVGHLYPVFFGFRGGKGAATLAGAVLVLAPQALAIMLAGWLIVILLTGYVGLATMLVALANIFVMQHIAPPESAQAYAGFSVVSALLVVFAHRGNIQRLIRGDEYCFQRAKLSRFWRR